MRFGLEEQIIERINRVFSEYPQLEKVILYGSRAKGNFRDGSDIDFVLKGRGLDLSVISSMLTKLDDLLLPYIFDLAVYEQIQNADLIEHIERVGKVFYERKAD